MSGDYEYGARKVDAEFCTAMFNQMVERGCDGRDMLCILAALAIAALEQVPPDERRMAFADWVASLLEMRGMEFGQRPTL
jgi:hypothetical protein